MEHVVRIGLIGLGQRGLATLARYAVIQGARINALGDLSAAAVEHAQQLLSSQGHQRVKGYIGESQWRKLCQSPDVDLVYLCTDWSSHARMAVYAMQQGKHVAIEVPAAMSVEDCWALVDTAEQTQQHCMMLENCCYDTFHLGLMGMVNKHVFGTLTHCEGAYIHHLNHDDEGWRTRSTLRHNGNPYPTHGLGPACQLLGINHGDRLSTLVSMTAPNSINNTIIRTQLGRTILLQFDENTPRPYSRLQTLCGTEGYAQKYPLPTLQLKDNEPLYGTQAEECVHSFQDPAIKKIIEEGSSLKVENTMNYTMDRRLVDALLCDKPLDMTVYDAALWSCITELSAQSVALGNQPVEIPDFTRGRWQEDGNA